MSEKPTNLSEGLLVSRKGLTNLRIPDKVVGEMQSSKNFLVIFAPRPNIIKVNIFPSDSEEIVKILIKLQEFSATTVKKIASIISDLNLPNLYTSGMCIKENECIYEAYIERDKLKVDLTSIPKEFEMIENVKSVEVFSLKLEGR
ncbi:MAG: hypothetical protein RBG13Loki_1497 [Promethearchaeota archaeon CR_4]|nr:MAG: hypothetical protein RBG13Loki_1497 [Candidatus Lokiarchaeota archaeon CR_4]